MTLWLRDIFGAPYNTTCTWLPLNHYLFQLANICLVVTYFAPPNSLNGLFLLRLSLALAGIFFGVWGGLIICALDTCIWNILFAIGNIIHMCYIFFKIRPRKFDEENEQLYTTVFEPLGVKRFQYNRLARIGRVNIILRNECYATQNEPVKEQLGFLLRGR